MALWPSKSFWGIDATREEMSARSQKLGLGLGAATVAGVVALSAALGDSAYLVGPYALAPIVAAIVAGPRVTAAVAVLALLTGLATEAWSAAPSEERRIVALAAIVIASTAAIMAARARDEVRRGMQRLRILNEIATVASSRPSVEQTLRAVETAVVPSFADFCMVDRYLGGSGSGGTESRRYLIAAADGAPRFRRRLLARPAAAGDSTGERGEEIADSAGGGGASLVEAIDEQHLRDLAFDDEDFEFLRSLGVESFLRAELRSRGKRLGGVTMAVAWSGRHYSPGDVEFAAALADRISLALDNSGLVRQLESAEGSMDAAMSVLDEAVVIHDSEGQLVFANPAAARLFGFEDPSPLIGLSVEAFRRLCRIYDESGAPIPFDDLAGLLEDAAGRPEPPVARVALPSEGREIWVRVRTRPVPAENGRSSNIVTAIEDLTAIKREELEQTVMARTGELLSRSNDYEGILDGLARLPVPHLSDCCSVDVLERDGSLRRVAVAHRDPEAADSEQLCEGSSLELDLSIGGERVGVVTLANESGRRPLDENDRRLAERVLGRARVALENARLATERTEIVRTLQQGLLPPPLPEIPGWDIAAHYRPSGREVEVGGDFYEAFRIKRGWMVIIGDVTGRGPGAASVTAQARYTLRTAGILSRDPRAALAALNRALIARAGSPLCSAAIVVLHEDSERADVAVAGHAPPFRIEPSGEIFEIGMPGPILGAFEDADWAIETFTIGRSRHLVLHTDGVTEATNGRDRFGDDRLRGALLAVSSPAGMLTRVEAELSEFCRDRLRDDVAIVTITPETVMESTEYSDIELVRSFYAAFDSGSIEGMLELSDERIEVDVPEVAASGSARSYRGHEGLRRCMSDLAEAWEDLIVTPRQLSMVGDRVVAKGRVYARSRVRGIRDVPMSWLWEVDRGRIVRCTSHPDLEEALGLAEKRNG